MVARAGVWGSKGWRDAAEGWARRRLDRLGLRPVGGMSDVSDQRWSWVWRIPTNRGDVLLKQTSTARAVEGSVHAFCADAAPEYVDQPLAYDPATARILFTDGGLTMAGDDWLAVPDPEAIAAMVTDYAHLQHATISRRRQAEAAGLPAWDPADTAHEAERQAGILHELPRSDPRHITTVQRDLLLTQLEALAVSGAVLVDSPIPSCVDQGDLWPGNVLVARPGGRHRFIDFGDAAWTHPFLSLMPLLFFCRRRWSLPGPFGDCLDHPDLRTIIDSYLRVWTDYASTRELRDILDHALRLTPLRRSRALLTNLERATTADTDDLGPTPWSWLTATTVPVGWSGSFGRMNSGQVPTVSVAELTDADFLLDVREDDEWAAGHAEGATHIPMSEFMARYGELAKAPQDARINVICRSGARSAQVTMYLGQQGMDAANVAGGMQDWAAAGRPVVTDKGEPGTVI